jgi:lipoprotein-anchoring transpeptidase ErfK/SrfK
MIKFFKHGGTIAWMLLLGIVLAVAFSAKLLADTMELRYQRDVYRMVFNDNVGVLEDLRAKLGTENENQQTVLDSKIDTNAPYIVISIAENRLWYKQRDSVLFTTRVATASGKTLVGQGEGQHWRFETPRGRLSITEKEENPAWVPPDWHYIEQAQKRGLGLVHLTRGQVIKGNDGAVYYAQGSDIIKQYPDGTTEPIRGSAEEGRELVVNGRIVIPPFGTNQRRYMGVLGTRRLKMPDGYAIHGTNNPASIGRSVSHGCIRMLNADIERLYPMVPVGTMVYIY